MFENLDNNYKMVFEDKILFEYDGGGVDNYIKVFRRGGQVGTGTKIVWQANDDDAGEYHYNASFDICARIYYRTGTPSGISEVDYDVTVLKRHKYNVTAPLS